MEGSVEEKRMLVEVPRGLGTNVYMITELTPSTAYTFEVAAENSADIGEFSAPHDAHTLGKAFNTV